MVFTGFFAQCNVMTLTNNVQFASLQYIITEYVKAEHEL